MILISDSKLVPQNGVAPRVAFVFIHEENRGDVVLRTLAERWRPHFPDALLALPLIDGLPEASRLAGAKEGLSLARFEEASSGFLEALVGYVAEIESEWKIPIERIALISFGCSVPLVTALALSRSRRFGAVIGFNSTAFLVQDIVQSVSAQPPILLVHGQLDPQTDSKSFLETLFSLEKSNLSVTNCFRPGIGREIDNYGADSAMFFLKGALSNLQFRTLPGKVETEEVAEPVKLIIWDLDETLWSGTLDEGAETLRLNEFRMNAIRQLNGHGLVSAICSKNDFSRARTQLEELGIWDEFVFPRISFEPKGPVIKSLIEQMQLRPQNCLFIDDNEINLAEAKSLLPELRVLDAKSSDCDRMLEGILAANRHVNKSRVAEYRKLEKRVEEVESFSGSREQFLHSCDIQVAFASSSDLIAFTRRIEELINRSNQLNYLKTRVSAGSIVDFVSEPSLREGFAVFAWDRFGYHGLVGFIGVDVKTETILHMAFSCRIMHMGIENALLHRAAKRFDNLQIPAEFGLDATLPPWITAHEFTETIRQKIAGEEGSLAKAGSEPEIRFMANCQSGIFSHFSGLRDVAEVDSHPRIFVMSMVPGNQHVHQNFPKLVVHYIGTDLYDIFWPAGTASLLEQGLYQYSSMQFCQFLQEKGCKLLIVGCQSDAEDDHSHVIRGVTKRRIALVNDVWRDLAAKNAHVTFLDVNEFVSADRMADCVHFRTDASRDIAQHIRNWYLTHSNAMAPRAVA